MSWKLVWSSEEYTIKPKETPFQPHIEVDTTNLSIPAEAEVGSTVYVGEIAIKGTSTTAVKVRAETVVNGEVVHYREWYSVYKGKMVGYIGEFTMPNSEVKVQLKVYELVES